MLLNPSGDTDEPGDKLFNIVVMDRNFPVHWPGTGVNKVFRVLRTFEYTFEEYEQSSG